MLLLVIVQLSLKLGHCHFVLSLETYALVVQSVAGGGIGPQGALLLGKTGKLLVGHAGQEVYDVLLDAHDADLPWDRLLMFRCRVDDKLFGMAKGSRTLSKRCSTANLSGAWF